MNTLSMPCLFTAARGARRTHAALLACLLCALVAGCNGDSSSDSQAAGVKSSNAAAGAGGASSPVPIVAMPGAGPCPASGTAALQSPSLNTQLNCAP